MTRHIHKSGARGLTLAEIMLSVVLGALVIITFYTCFVYFLKYDRRIQVRRLALGLCRDRLSKIMDLDFTQIPVGTGATNSHVGAYLAGHTGKYGIPFTFSLTVKPVDLQCAMSEYIPTTDTWDQSMFDCKDRLKKILLTVTWPAEGTDESGPSSSLALFTMKAKLK